MLTVPITTTHFHSRVLGLLSSYLSNLQSPSFDRIGTMATSQNTRPLTIPPLTKLDSNLTPNDATSQLVGVTSSWIDLCSPDPLIADLSRQVLMLEVAYAAFCGIGYLLIPSTKLHHGGMHSEGVVYYARAIQDALNLGPYIQFHIWLRMVDNPELEVDSMGDLAPLARQEYLQLEAGNLPKIDPFGTWDAWDLIRKTCKYHTRLFVGEFNPLSLSEFLSLSRAFAYLDTSLGHAQAAACSFRSIALALGACTSPYNRFFIVLEEPERISRFVKGPPILDRETDAPSHSSMDFALQCWPYSWP